jgi:hypothetical protein
VSADHHPRLKSGLLSGEANGIADLSDRLMREGDDAELVVFGVLRRAGYVHTDDDRIDVPILRFVSIDEADAEDAKWIRAKLNKNAAERRSIAGQLELGEPTELSEMVAEFEEFADDIGQSVDALKADFAEWHDREHGSKKSPEGTDPQTIRAYLAARRLEDNAALPSRNDIEDPNPDGEWEDEPVHTTESPVPVDA